MKALFGAWWATPVQGVSIEGVSIDRNRLQAKLSAGATKGSFVVAHASDAGPFAPGMDPIPAGAAFRAALSCPGCDAAARARLATAIERWSAGAASGRDNVWVARPAPRATPEPGSIENIPQGKTPEETVFEVGEDPSTETTAGPSNPAAGDGKGPARPPADPHAPAAAGGLAPPAASRPLGRYVLLAALIALLVWLLRAPPGNESAAPVAASGSAPSGDPASAPAVAAATVDPSAAAVPEAVEAESGGSAATASPDGQSKPG